MAESGIISMTGFGQAKSEGAQACYEVEIRSVNHRFLELGIKVPRALSPIEGEIRSLVSSFLRRGKVDLLISRRLPNSAARNIEFNDDTFNAYVELYRKLFSECACDFEAVKPQILLQILGKGEIFLSSEESCDLENEKSLIFFAVEEALKSLLQMRKNEGAKLNEEVLVRLQTLESLKEKVSELAALGPDKIRDKIAQRLKKLPPEITVDEGRLAAELVLYCDRADITEEIVRLGSHFGQFRLAMAESNCGKKLDFLVQEFLREFNTIASKAQDAAIQTLVVEAKTEIEKIKEQIQNVE